MNWYYQDEWTTLYCGDARDVLPALSGIDAVITDPPYGVGLKAKRSHLTAGGVSFTKVREGHYDHPDTPEYVRDVIVPIIGVCRKLAPAVAVTPGNRNAWLYPSPDDVGGFYSAAATGVGPWGFVCLHPILYYGKDPYLARGLGSRPNSYSTAKTGDANRQAHPCAKPLAWMKWLVWRASLPGQAILDPFAGSGTTLVAAALQSRKAIGIELSERFCDAAAQRLQRLATRGREVAAESGEGR